MGRFCRDLVLDTVLDTMPKKSKNINGQYKVQDLEIAAAQVQAEKMSIRMAAKHYNVLKSTISDRVSGRVEPGATPGKKTVFSRQVEDEVANKMIKPPEKDSAYLDVS
ncbi:hypothetical protein KUTeg_024416 [Tegillarca granosa]|uniref:HTH psq-type domain-containing protein n=1 Tax=Tegillarca granosa TaxID=220873 RepID=A0ABQ9E2Y2_TEGGR|nr:hypothetical protein KUTeg_024416 [Tegillarca granosa]